MSDSDTSLVVRGETCRRLNACFQEVEPVTVNRSCWGWVKWNNMSLPPLYINWDKNCNTIIQPEQKKIKLGINDISIHIIFQVLVSLYIWNESSSLDFDKYHGNKSTHLILEDRILYRVISLELFPYQTF